MKLLLTTLTLGAALCLASGARADNSLMPPPDNRCSLSAGAPVIDYGEQSRWQLQEIHAGQSVSPGKRTVTVNAICPYSQSMRMRLNGDKAANGNLRYGEQGNVSLRFVEAQLDGQDVQLVTTTPDGVLNGAPGSNLLWQPGVSVAATRNGQLIKGKSFTARIEIEPMMPESAARVSARQVSEANLTLELMD